MLPGYLDAVTDLATPALPGWAELNRKAITAESADGPLPLAPQAASPPRLRAMLEQAPASALGWLRGEAGLWYRRHTARAGATL